MNKHHGVLILLSCYEKIKFKMSEINFINLDKC